MNILYISQYFHPEVGAPSNRALANVKLFQKKGHNVTVLAEMPNHPSGVIFREYRNKIYVMDTVEDIFVNRAWVYTSKRKNFLSRIGMYLSFSITASIYVLFKWKKFDIVYVTSPPLFVGLVGLFTKWVHPKTKFVFEVRDLWPDVAIEMGQLANPKFKKISFALEKRIYLKADMIVSVTERFKDKIITKGISEVKIIVARNGANLALKRAQNIEDKIIKLKSKNDFVIIYAGNIGLAQNVMTILKTAQLLKNENIRFLIVGIGPERNKIEKYVSDKSIKNVILIGEIPFDKISEYLSIADCGIIPLRNIPVFESTIPSKMFDYMAVNLPIILGVKGESKIILEESGAGISYKPEDHEDLKEKILFLIQNPDKLDIMSTKGRKFVEEKFDREKIAETIEQELRIILKGE